MKRRDRLGRYEPILAKADGREIPPRVFLSQKWGQKVHSRRYGDIALMMPPETSAKAEQFSRLLITSQPRLYGFVYSLVHDHAATNDILQDVSTVLWRKFDQFEVGSDFGAWAMKVAKFTVFNWRRRQAALPLDLDEETLEALAASAVDQSCEHEAREEALDFCLGKLPERDRTLIAARYDEGEAVVEIAEREGRSRRAVYKHLKRLHQALLDCIDGQMEGSPTT